MTEQSERRYPVRNRIRLDSTAYAVEGLVAAITITTRDRAPIFDHRDLCHHCVESLRKVSETHGLVVLAYCFMPDHLHLLVDNRQGIDLIAFVRRYKSWTTRLAWNFGFEGSIWQRSFYDHVLRESEDPVERIRYILNNPVRAGVVDVWDEYEWSGSFVYDVSDPSEWGI